MNLPLILHPFEKNIIESHIKNGHMSILKYGKNEILHFDGDLCSFLEIILDGYIVVERIDESGNLLTVAEFFPDDLIGGNLIFSKNPYYPMTISSKTNSKILKIPKNLVFTLCTENKDFLYLFLQSISDNALILGSKIKHHVNRSIRKKVISFLRQEYLIQKSETIKLNITKKSLADRMGIQRTSLSRELQKMKNDGLIDYDSSTITIIEKEILYF